MGSIAEDDGYERELVADRGGTKTSAGSALWPSRPAKRPYRDVLTTQGRVRGYFFPGPPHYAFLGVPYARPPTRNDRFKAPEPPPQWDGIFEATHRIKCPQIDEDGVENCLVINVFAPEHGASLPVIVHVHDGDFQTGWGSYRAPQQLLNESFVIVTFNYRLGALGFLCLGSTEAPGNAGLKDQIAALYWVQRNIKNFGGNSLDITVYGTGSGAVAVELLLLSGITTGLFHRVILESGSALAPTSVTYTPFSSALNVASLLGYDGEAKPNKLARFFQNTSVRKLVNLTEMFLPCVERDVQNTNSLLDMDPLDVLKDAHFFHVPIMIAYTNALEVKIISDNMERFRTIPNDFENLLPNNLDFENEEFKLKLARLVKEFYFGENEIGNSLIPNYVDYVNDIFIEYPVVKSAILHARATQPVYLLKFTYKGIMSSMKNEEIPGAGHGDLYMYIFSNERLSNEERVVADRLVKLVTNFIKLG
ncbi:juvenile hormone esterase-like [Battus philenor]|uniref:juvenile hormone esterase-like n=1 Tax=Battus philenor TaxID=42288 RepID=UPI0035D10FEE